MALIRILEATLVNAVTVCEVFGALGNGGEMALVENSCAPFAALELVAGPASRRVPAVPADLEDA